MTIALVALTLMLVLAFLRVPIAFSMGLIGFLGVAYLRDWNFAKLWLCRALTEDAA